MVKVKPLHHYLPLLGLVLFLLALWVLHRELADYHLNDILQHAKSLSLLNIFWGLVLTVLSYLIMTGYDTLALIFIQHPLPYRKNCLCFFRRLCLQQ